MFPPTTPHTERVRIELENQEIEQRAALNASLSDGEKPNVVQAITRLLKRERKPHQADLQPKPSTSRAEQTI